MKFNLKAKNVNHEGATAWTMSAPLELYTAVVTTMLSDKFYESADERLTRLRKLVEVCDPVFTAKLAVYAREQMHLRTAPLVLAALLSQRHNGDGLVRKTVGRVVSRADEIAELLACYQTLEGRTGVKKLNKLSKQVQKGLSDAFNKFDEYQFAKYDRTGAVRLRDALFLIHPKAKDEAQQALFDKIARQELATPYTWEVELSRMGQTTASADRNADFRDKWKELILSGRVGYMAMLRNLRNWLNYDLDAETLQTALARLTDPATVAASKQLPFRFLAAYREIKAMDHGLAPLVLEALEAAAAASVANVQGFGADTKVLVACDVSGSMQTPVSAKSSIQNYDVGLLLAMLLQSRCKHVLAGMFGDTWLPVTLPRTSVLSNVMELHAREGEVGYSTNGHKVLEWLIAHREPLDKVFFFTDCQLWDTTGADKSFANRWNDYKRIAPNAKLYVFDLAGLGTTPISLLREDVTLVAGWSDKVFDVLAACEAGESALQVVEAVEL